MTASDALRPEYASALSNAQLRGLLGFIAAEINRAVRVADPTVAIVLTEACFAVHRAVVLLGDDV